MNTFALLVAFTAVFALGITGLLGIPLIPLLHKLKFGQTILDIGPAWHKKKQGTPTMGGLLFIVGILFSLLLAVVVCETVLDIPLFTTPISTGVRLVAGVLLALGSGLIGFVDDYIKVVKKRNLGLTSGQKIFLQLFLAAIYALTLYLGGASDVYVPGLGSVDLGLWFLPLCIFFAVGFPNATNLTDGIDGLCGTVGFVAALAFLVTAGIMGSMGQTLFAAALAGGLAGFLVWNLHPAKVFMGDTGSLFIGGALCALAFGLGQPLLLIPFGIVFIWETLSVMLQVSYFKLTHGKRLFKMSPFHHHLEMCGWKENKIVLVFGGITLLCSAAALCLLFL